MARKLWVTKQLMKPITEIQDIVNKDFMWEGPKYRMYSVHSDSMANILT